MMGFIKGLFKERVVADKVKMCDIHDDQGEVIYHDCLIITQTTAKKRGKGFTTTKIVIPADVDCDRFNIGVTAKIC